MPGWVPALDGNEEGAVSPCARASSGDERPAGSRAIPSFDAKRFCHRNKNVITFLTQKRLSTSTIRMHHLFANWGIVAANLHQIPNLLGLVDFLWVVPIENDTKANSVGDKLFFSDPAF